MMDAYYRVLKIGGVLILLGLLVAGFIVFLVPEATAVSVVWDGSESTLWNNGDNWVGGSAPSTSDIAVFDGSGTGDVSINVDIDVLGIDINSGYTGTITQAAGVTVDVGTSDFDISDGTFTGGDSAITIDDDFTISGGAFTSTTDNLQISGMFTVSSGSFAPSTGTVTSVGNAQTWDVAATETFNNFTIYNTHTAVLNINADDAFVITGTLTLTDGKVNTGTFNAQGAISQASTFDGGSATIEFDAAAAQTYTVNGGTTPNIELDSSDDASDSITFTAASSITGINTTAGFSGTIPITNTSDDTLSFTSWTQAAGTIDASAQTAWNVGSFDITGGTFTPPATVTANVNFGAWNFDTTETFNNATVAVGNGSWLDITSGDTLVTTGTLTLTDGSVRFGTFNAQGNIVVGSGFDGGSSPLIISGSGTNTFDLTGATGSFNGLVTVNKSGGSMTLASALDMDANSQHLTIEEGVFGLGGFALNVDGSSSTLTVETGGTLQLQGAEVLTLNASQPTLDSGSTVTYTGDGDALADTYTLTTLKSTYHHLNITSTDGTTDTFDLGAAIDINGDFSNSGTFDVSGTSYAVNLAGDWGNTGTFTAQSGTVTMDGTSQAFTGATTFNAFTKIVAAADTLTFPASVKQTFTGTMTLQGASGQLLSLVSSSPSTQTQIDPQGTRTVEYLDVQDSNNTNASAVSCSTGCVSSGNNINWALPGVTVSSISGNTTEGLGQVTFTVVLDAQPSNNVTTTIVSSDTGEGTVDKSILTFTNGNWSDAQTVTVTGVNDDVDDGNIAYTITTGTTSSSDSSFNGIDPDDVSVTNTDNDTVGITVGSISGNTTESGGEATFTVVLDTEPTDSVTVGVASDNTDEGTVSTALLTFTTGNWGDEQTVTVTGVDDAVIDGDIIYNVVLAEAGSTDGLYDVINPADVSVINTDNDALSGGDGVGNPPSDTLAVVSGLETCDPDTAVLLSLFARGASEVLISNSSSFTGIVWQAFDGSVDSQGIETQIFDWQLKDIDSKQIIYIIFRSDKGVMSVLQTEGTILRSDPYCEGAEDPVKPDFPEEIVESIEIKAGHYVRAISYETIYFIDDDLNRRPFYTADMYLTYESSFDPIFAVSDEQLKDFPLGIPMVPRAESGLIQFQSLNDIYAAEQDRGKVILRLIPSDSIASSVFGTDWMSRVISLPPTMWSLYIRKSSIDTNYTP